ncbi:MAG: histidine kinase [Flavobacteriaceae bacterium]|nr:histidine kinase [Flavobacteriaceae bacterium]
MKESSTNVEYGFWQVLVQDNGIGIAIKNIERIFKPFERLHGKSIYEGTGIGLAICQKIIERHHGTITVKS